MSDPGQAYADWYWSTWPDPDPEVANMQRLADAWKQQEAVNPLAQETPRLDSIEKRLGEIGLDLTRYELYKAADAESIAHHSGEFRAVDTQLGRAFATRR